MDTDVEQILSNSASIHKGNSFVVSVQSMILPQFCGFLGKPLKWIVW